MTCWRINSLSWFGWFLGEIIFAFFACKTFSICSQTVFPVFFHCFSFSVLKMENRLNLMVSFLSCKNIRFYSTWSCFLCADLILCSPTNGPNAKSEIIRVFSFICSPQFHLNSIHRSLFIFSLREISCEFHFKGRRRKYVQTLSE